MTAGAAGPAGPQAPDGTRLDTPQRAIADIAAGRPVVVVDDADRENEGDLILAAEMVTQEAIAFMVRHTSGVICLPVTGERLDELHIRPMVSENTESHETAFTVWIAGAGVKAGTIYGATDEMGMKSVENITEVYDLHASILYLLGLDHKKLTFRFQGRDFRLTDVEGELVTKLLA